MSFSKKLSHLVTFTVCFGTLSGFLATVEATTKAIDQFELKFDDVNFTETTEISARLAANSFLDAVTRKLPSVMKEALGHRFVIKFDSGMTDFKLPKCTNSDEPTSSHPIYYGSTSVFSRTIQMNPAFKQIIIAGEARAATYPCGHKNAYRLAEATLIHELAHQYDLLAIKTAAEQSLANRCFDTPWSNDFRDPDCFKAKYLDLSVSTRKEYFLLAGWSEQGFIDSELSRRNFRSSLSPDAYEFSSLQESFAVNLEFFLLDPEYVCRKPLMAQFFGDHFRADPYPGQSCKISHQVKVQSSDATEQSGTVNLDPSRVYQVHYLFAGKGDALMSRWGHAMYRIVLCSPEREQVGPECLQDISHHIVVSFRANVSDLVLSPLKGLTGGYPSQMFLMPMISTVEEYTSLESRDLFSIPLQLTEAEKVRFILNTLAHYWGYRGKYRFLSNNCANESLWFLQMATLKDRDLHELNASTPLGLFEEFDRLGVTDHAVYESALRGDKEARKLGYLFKSKKESILKAFKGISLYMPFTELDHFTNDSDANERRNYFVRTIQNGAFATGQEKLVFASQFFVIEKTIQRAKSNQLQQKFMSLLESPEAPEPTQSKAATVAKPQTFREKVRKLVNLRSAEAIDSFSLSNHYGLPQEGELVEGDLSHETANGGTREPGAPSPKWHQQQMYQKLYQAVLDDPGFAPFKSSIDELKQIEANLLFFRKNISTSFDLAFPQSVVR